MSNTCVVPGRLGRDSELRRTQSDKQVLNFAVACDVGFGDRKTTQWFDCELWGKRAEGLAPHLKKGVPLTVWGEVRMVTFEKRDGTSGAKMVLDVNEVVLQGGGQQQQSYSNQQQTHDPDMPF